MAQFTTSLANFDNPHHARAIVELIQEYANEDHGGGQPLPEEIASQIVPGMQQTPGAFTILAWEKELPVGVAVCFQAFSTFSARPLVNVQDLSVSRSYRGQGIGTMLLTAVESHARQLGCCKVTLEVRTANPRAEQLYRRLGYADPDGFATRFLDKRL